VLNLCPEKIAYMVSMTNTAHNIPFSLAGDLSVASRKAVTIHYRKLADNKPFKEPTLEAAIRSAMAHSDQGTVLADRYRPIP